MRLETTTVGNVKRYTLEISDVELERARFQPLDRMLFRDIAENAGDDGHAVSDVLLGLQLLARRVEEAPA